jgi:hypothetical protein
LTVPPWVTSVEQYADWLGQVIDQSGGIPEPHYLIADIAPLVEHLGLGVDHPMVIDRHELLFPSNGALTFRLIVVEHLTLDLDLVDIEQTWYTYHFRTEDERLVFRYCKHDDHHGLGECHVHLPRGRGERVVASQEVDLADVVELIHEYLGWKPKS